MTITLNAATTLMPGRHHESRGLQPQGSQTPTTIRFRLLNCKDYRLTRLVFLLHKDAKMADTEGTVFLY